MSEVKYRGVVVPEQYHDNLDSPGFAHWCKGVESAKLAEPDPYRYFLHKDRDILWKMPITGEAGEIFRGPDQGWTGDAGHWHESACDLTDFTDPTETSTREISQDEIPSWVKD